MCCVLYIFIIYYILYILCVYTSTTASTSSPLGATHNITVERLAIITDLAKAAKKKGKKGPASGFGPVSCALRQQPSGQLESCNWAGQGMGVIPAGAAIGYIYIWE